MKKTYPADLDPELLIDIDKVLETKAPKLKRWLPRFVVSYLKHIVHQDDVNDFIVSKRYSIGIPYAKDIYEKFGATVSIFGLENLPDEGRFIFASNHPMGGLDGMAFIHAVGKKFQNLKFPVNDILLFVKNFRDIFLPVNKTGPTGRHAAELMEEAFASDNQILMFPAGLCSRKINGKIVDLEWKKGFVSKAIQYQRDIIPVYISGRNSNFFYNLSNIRKKLGIKVNIEMLYLVDEMYKQKGRHIDVYFGKPIKWQTLENRPAREVAQEIKKISENLYTQK
ncbi:MAG: 1-acyl-sn-glycerol-3-phosphate acyltransferase [Marinilabiliaceae bacterium]|nr:1-acyl-sn-glycerol-3-phosphate acyltransferase [Marinilabiliaceae bacterium]